MYYCVNILLTKNALEHVHLEDKFVQNQLHIAGRLTGFSFSYNPVVSQYISLLKPSVFFSASKLDGHWINACDYAGLDSGLLHEGCLSKDWISF